MECTSFPANNGKLLVIIIVCLILAL